MLKPIAERLVISSLSATSNSSSSLPSPLSSQHSSRATSPSPPSGSIQSPSSNQRNPMYSSKPVSRQQQIPKPTVSTSSVSGIPSSIGSTGSIGSIVNGLRRGIPSAIATPKTTLPLPSPLPVHSEKHDQPNNNNSNIVQPSVTNASSSSLDISRPDSPSATPASKSENVTVTVRIRPFSSSELKVAGGPTEVWAVSDDDSKIMYNDDYAVFARRTAVEYAFDHALTGSDNEMIYNSSVKNLVQSAMEGYNGTVFAYGQTSSGKTYTMSGNETQPGITPRAVEDIFKYIRENSDREFLLRVSYLEIYNESIKDLLSPEAIDLKIHEDKRIVESRDRSPGSSGSPTSRKPLGAKTAAAVRVSQLNLIDLAGSEKAASNEERRKEGAFINKSLLTLGTVISKLTEERGAHIPYRDSKLTRILQPSLNGNARVSVICTISPSHLNVEESNNTLKFAARVKKVVTKAQTNQVMDDKALLEKYRREISELKAQLMVTASGESGASANGKNAELSSLLQKERMKHEEEMVEMNKVRGALKERIEHLTKLILTSQSINSKSSAPEVPAGRSTVEVSSDGTVSEFPKDIESRLAHKDAMVKQLEAELEAQQEKMALMKITLEKTAKGETVDIEKTLAKVEQDLPREKLLNSKRASIVSMYSLEQMTSAGGDPESLTESQRVERQRQQSEGYPNGIDADDDSDEDLMDTPWSREELKSLRQAKRELEIIVIEQEKKLEDMVMADDSDEFRDLVFELQEHREKIIVLEEERDSYKMNITNLKNTIRKLELNQSTATQFDASQSASAGSAHNLAIAAAKIRELEQFAKKEKRLRMDEQSRNMGRIASLEAELTMLKAELSVRNLATY
ncbi:hypothetical protein BGZ76_007316 [Entomortierella beljakovae]|nr:hypothetical protein BGZ76_007316 [Entomortierella beljakovae]